MTSNMINKNNPSPSGEEITHKLLFFYSLPMLAAGMMNFLSANLLMKYATDALLIAPATMGFLFFLSRIWDAINDPLCGYYSDHTASPIGRRRFWIAMSALPISIFFYAIWTPLGKTPQENIIWLAIAMIGFYTALTAFYVPHYSMGAELSKNKHQRNRIYGSRTIWENLGNFLGVALMASLGAISLAKEKTETLMVGASIFAFVIIMIMVRFTPEKPSKKMKATERPGFIETFISIFANPHARLILLVGFFSQLGAAIIFVVTLYFAHYILQDEKSGSLLIGVFMIAATASVPLWIKVLKVFNKIKIWMYCNITVGISFALTWFLGKGDVNAMLSLALLAGIAAGAILIIHPATLADTIDYDTDKSGEQKQGAYFSFFTFVNKSAIGISGILIGLIMQLGGYTPNVVQPENSAWTIRMLYAFFPLVSFTIATILLMFYSLEKQNQDIDR